MIIRQQRKDERLMYGEDLPITICIGNTCEYFSIEDFEKLKTKLNTFDIPVVVSTSKCYNVDCREMTEVDSVYCGFHGSM